jgi:hypothetical protein
MRQAPWVARFSDQILLLHPSIFKVLLLEEKGDRFVIVEEATRTGIGRFPCDIDQSLTNGPLNPAKILGASADWKMGTPKLVTVLYSHQALMLTRLSSRSILAICAEPSEFDEAMQSVNQALPALTQTTEVDILPVTNPKSATEAAEIARNYVAAVVKSPDVSVDEVTLHQTEGLWEVQGSYRSNPFARSRRFELQLSCENGAITKFISPQRSSLGPLVTGISVILGTVIFLVWLLFLSR